MSNSSEFPSAANEPARPESFENRSHILLTNPLEVDLNQPSRTVRGITELVTGMTESKLVAEIKTPTDNLWVLNTEIEIGSDMHDTVSAIMVVGKHYKDKVVLDPGVGYDFSDQGEVGRCIVSLDESGSRLFVHADNPDHRYQIFTRELEQYRAPTDDELFVEAEG